MRKAELSFLYITRHLILFYISTKYHRNIPEDIQVTERTRNLFQIKQRVITPKVRKPELSVLYAIHHLVLIYISTKYHQNIPKDIQVTEWTRSFMPTPTGSIPKTVCPHTIVGRRGHNYPKDWSVFFFHFFFSFFFFFFFFFFLLKKNIFCGYSAEVHLGHVECG